jgi:hypothetical protein
MVDSSRDLGTIDLVGAYLRTLGLISNATVRMAWHPGDALEKVVGAIRVWSAGDASVTMPM